ncbi:hypothetical protein Plec18170_004359 [Paecilomyces lecythidis]
MSPTPPSTTSSSAGAHSPEGQFRVIRKRNRVPLSCAPCRHRKLKCNRSHPCENCIKRGDAASCTYAQPGVRKKTTLNQNAVATPDDMQNRIDRLEGLVLSLMTNGSQSAGPTAAAAALSGHGSIDSGRTSNDTSGDGHEMDDGQDESDTEQVTKSFGIMKVDNNKSYYISDAHWASVLNDIAEVRNYFTVHKKQYEEQAEKVKALRKDTDFPGSALLFGTVKPLSQAEIMSSFPSKYITDILIARYFNSYDPSTHILHGPTFQKEYNRHWEDPSQTCIVWVGMLFVMMRLAMLSYHRDGDEPPEFRGKALDMAGTYRNMMAQCLTLADYTKPHPHLIETLILHLHGDYSQTRETETSVWILVGMIARLAMRMGYHRDSKMFPNITPFQGEMRRRVWTFVKQADLLFSFQVGLPSMIRPGDSDTELPTNLYDEDFDENCKELPPPRPLNEPTPVSYLIAKAQLAYAFGRVIEHTSSVKSGPYETVMEIDSELRRVQDMIPEHLQVRPMEECQLDPASLIVSRFSINSLYHKAQVVLHRRYLPRARENPRFTHSRRTCIDSSLELLSYQSIIHAETRPNGRLRTLAHQVMSLSSNDFLLSATVVCLDLYHGLQLQAAGRPSGDTYAWGVERRDEMLAAIRRSKEIWDDLRDQSIEAWKASSILGVMLAKLHLGPQGTETSTASAPVFEPQDEKENAAMTLGLLSSGMSPLNSGNAAFSDPAFRMAETSSPPAGLGVPGMPQGAPSPFSMLGAMPDMQPVNLDWEAWDSYIQSSTFDPSNQLWPMLDVQQQQQPSPSPISPSTIPTARNGVPPYRPLPGLFPSQSSYDNGSSPENGVFMNLPRYAFQQRWNSNETAKDASEQRPVVDPIAESASAEATKQDVSEATEEATQTDAALESDAPRPSRRPVMAPPEPKETIYIGNLFFDVTAEDLKNQMQKFGVVETTRIVHDNRGLSKGFGYVTFDSIESAQRAIQAMNMQVFEGRRIVAQFAQSNAGRRNRTRNAPTKTLFIGNMAFDMTDRDLNDLFKDVDNVIDVRVAIDRRTGQPRGFAHADFIDVASAESAMEILSAKAPYGRRLRVDYSYTTRDDFKNRSRGDTSNQPIESGPQ